MSLNFTVPGANVKVEITYRPEGEAWAPATTPRDRILPHIDLGIEGIEFMDNINSADRTPDSQRNSGGGVTPGNSYPWISCNGGITDTIFDRPIIARYSWSLTGAQRLVTEYQKYYGHPIFIKGSDDKNRDAERNDVIVRPPYLLFDPVTGDCLNSDNTYVTAEQGGRTPWVTGARLQQNPDLVVGGRIQLLLVVGDNVPIKYAGGFQNYETGLDHIDRQLVLEVGVITSPGRTDTRLSPNNNTASRTPAPSAFTQPTLTEIGSPPPGVLPRTDPVMTTSNAKVISHEGNPADQFLIAGDVVEIQGEDVYELELYGVDINLTPAVLINGEARLRFLDDASNASFRLTAIEVLQGDRWRVTATHRTGVITNTTGAA